MLALVASVTCVSQVPPPPAAPPPTSAAGAARRVKRKSCAARCTAVVATNAAGSWRESHSNLGST